MIILLVALAALGTWSSVAADEHGPNSLQPKESTTLKKTTSTQQKNTHNPSQELPLRKDSVIPHRTMIRVLIAILVGLVLAFALAYLLKKYLFVRDLMGSGGQRMQLLEARRLTPRLTLYMLRIDDRTIVLAQSGERLVSLDPSKSFKDQAVSMENEASAK
jgi:flagellar biogenesis protein FliO